LQCGQRLLALRPQQGQDRNWWVYGAGVETLIAKYWSIRAEYLRYDFDEEVYVVGTTASGKTIPANILKQDVDTVRLGINYNFGTP